MTATPIPIDHWPNRIGDVLAKHCSLLRNVIVVRETDSTQDAARRMNARAGDVIVTWQQTAGRGRFGRNWLDTGEDGVATTITLPRGTSEQLAIASAVGAAHAIEFLLGRAVGIKWPNDLLVDGRKLAGILVEQTDALALIGIGINVRQMKWPEELADRAVSLLQLGSDVDRLDVIAALLPAIDQAMQLDCDRLAEEFKARDALCGKCASFRHGERTYSGIISRIDPLKGLAIEAEDGEVWLPAASTTVLRA